MRKSLIPMVWTPIDVQKNQFHTYKGNHKGLPLHLWNYLQGQPQGIAPTFVKLFILKTKNIGF